MDRRKKNNYDRIEPMPRKLFLELMREFKESGGKYIASEQSEAFLDSQGAEASAINATTILFRRRPSRAAVYEELFHVCQFRDGKIKGTVKNSIECEIEAKEYLLSNADRLQLTQSEIQKTREDLEWYKIQLREQKGEENDGM